MITLDIPHSTPSQNATHHKHWREAFDQRKLWEHFIWIAKVQFLGGRGLPDPPPRARVTLTRYGRQLDVTNFIGGLKAPIDALKLQGLIIDDDEKHLELIATQQSGEPRTVIVIEPCSTLSTGILEPEKIT